MSVVFAMMTSYFLSRTLVPTMIHYLLGPEVERELAHSNADSEPKRSLFWHIHDIFNQLFNGMRRIYGGWLAWALDHRAAVIVAFLLFVTSSCGLVLLIGQDFFPTVDAGQIRFHVRAPPGTRIEETERYFAKVEDVVHKIIPPAELKTALDNIGIPNSGINLALSDGSLISSADGEISITLAEEHRPTAEYVKEIRTQLSQQFPELVVYFQPPDISTQVLNFGLPAPIDVQIAGPRRNIPENLKLAYLIRDKMSAIPGAVDAHLQQVPNAPELHIDVDRTMASQLGVSQRDVAGDVLVSLSSSGQAAPNYWLDPKTGVQYILAVQTPQYKMNSVTGINNTPVTVGNQANPQLLGNLGAVTRSFSPVNITHYAVAPTFDVLAGVQDQDLGRVAAGVDRVLDEVGGPPDPVTKVRPKLPRGTTVIIRGQVESMRTSFRGLSFGLIFAVLLVYLLLVVNFQSWSDPFVILMALPGALAGILWMLFATGTNICVPSLMGAIMSIGTATANSILLVTFANDQRAEGQSAMDAAWIAGVTRLRPVLMTALAMILGMLPMSLGLGEGGEQNAPLGRAVIGGLICATFATLFFVPVIYTIVRRKQHKTDALELEVAQAQEAASKATTVHA